MSNSEAIAVRPALAGEVSDAELETLLQRVYVAGGFTPAELATRLFAAAAVRARGEILIAKAPNGSELLGLVIVVAPTSPARRIAKSDEAEMHLLAVAPEHRARGIGARLIEAATLAARRAGWTRMVLWTQPSMHAAQRLYLADGFVRVPEREREIAELSGREFLVFQKSL